MNRRGGGAVEQRVDNLLDPGERVEGGTEVRSLALPALQQLEVTARDRERSPQLVRRAVEEPFVTVDQLNRGPSSRARCVPATRRGENGERKKHQRELERFRGELQRDRWRATL
ncbi:MAG: hypothetical protein M3R39_11025 [Actinomycetota bacterium]|nr:hypothetical protein [Actinomycetota bacterium]